MRLVIEAIFRPLREGLVMWVLVRLVTVALALALTAAAYLNIGQALGFGPWAQAAGDTVELIHAPSKEAGA